MWRSRRVMLLSTTKKTSWHRFNRTTVSVLSSRGFASRVPPKDDISSSSSSSSSLSSLASSTPPDQAEIVIIGGGVIGCSIAYHLSLMGKKDIVLLERNKLTSGCTWHAAGLLGQLRNNLNLTRMLQHSASLYGRIESETGQTAEWKPTGSIRVAASQDRWIELRKSYTAARTFGFDCHLITPKEAVDLCPIMNASDLVGALWVPTDGSIEPTSLTNALAIGAKKRGVRIYSGVTVTAANDDQSSNRRISSLQLSNGRTIRCQTVVNSAGLWARHVGQLLGVNVPTVNVEHQYLVTEAIPNLPKNLPSIRDPDLRIYYKPEVRGLAIGGWETDTVYSPVPLNFGSELYTSNFERFEGLAKGASHRTPILEKVGIDTLINGPIPVSPDGEPIMGRAPERDNVFVAAGFTAGIGAAGGAGRMMAEWIVNGEPSLDLWPLDIRRFGSHHNNLHFLKARTVEAYGHYYELHPPGYEFHSARPIRTSPLYSSLKSSGAVFGSKFLFERANWFNNTNNNNTSATHINSKSVSRPTKKNNNNTASFT